MDNKANINPDGEPKHHVVSGCQSVDSELDGHVWTPDMEAPRRKIAEVEISYLASHDWVKGNRNKLNLRRREIIDDYALGRISIKSAKDAWHEFTDGIKREHDKNWVSCNIPHLYGCPVDRDRLPNPKAFDQVMGFLHEEDDGEPTWMAQDKNPGLVAFGRTGQGKTFSMYQLMIGALEKNWACTSNIKMVYAPDMASTIHKLSVRNPHDLSDYLDEIMWAEWLFIDDLHQAKLTPGYGEKLVRIFEKRYSEGLWTFLTVQVPGDALVQRMTAGNPQLREVAEAIVRRIREMCQPVDFDCQ